LRENVMESLERIVEASPNKSVGKALRAFAVNLGMVAGIGALTALGAFLGDADAVAAMIQDLPPWAVVAIMLAAGPLGEYLRNLNKYGK